MAAVLLLSLTQTACGQAAFEAKPLGQEETAPVPVRTGADRTEQWLPLLKGKKVGLIANPTSRIGQTHLVDTMLSLGVQVSKVFAPEHGFRGDHGAGEKVSDEKDERTGLPVVSLYGSHKKPLPADLKGLDVVVFDIQDVGARFYTYISTMHYAMEACAENNVAFVVLDRPNPNGFYVDGPVLDDSVKSFIGMHPIPIVHGMTVGELARMINGEGWLEGGRACNLQVVTCEHWDHSMFYELPMKPSPNLPDMASIYLYPSLCLFEGTVMSVGRGTDKPFQVFGHPDFKAGKITFTPQSIPGAAPDPKFKGELCKGMDVTEFGDIYIKNAGRLYLFWLLEAYRDMNMGKDFFRSSFDKLAGNHALRRQIMAQVQEEDIRKSWEPALSDFKQLRRKYLLYPDFE
ncbi:MAG: DUF1343 domain-containing protein [Flavobacteriales bacterium]|nr:DUF1343 domain-containing protein [Flavobacteriales bacterium]